DLLHSCRGLCRRRAQARAARAHRRGDARHRRCAEQRPARQAAVEHAGRARARWAAICVRRSGNRYRAGARHESYSDAARRPTDRTDRLHGAVAATGVSRGGAQRYRRRSAEELGEVGDGGVTSAVGNEQLCVQNKVLSSETKSLPEKHSPFAKNKVFSWELRRTRCCSQSPDSRRPSTISLSCCRSELPSPSHAPRHHNNPRLLNRVATCFSPLICTPFSGPSHRPWARPPHPYLLYLPPVSGHR